MVNRFHTNINPHHRLIRIADHLVNLFLLYDISKQDYLLVELLPEPELLPDPELIVDVVERI